MSLLANGGGNAGGNQSGAEGADDAAAKAAAAAGAGGDGGAGGKGAAEEQPDTFDVNALGDELKNPEIYKGGKFFGKYANLGEVAKGIKELTGQMRNGGKAPEKYDFANVKVEGHDDLKVDENDPVAQAVLPVLKKHGISQEVANDLAAAYLGGFAGTQTDPKKEIESLGKDGGAMIDNINEMMKGMSKEDQEDILAITTTAAGVRFVHRQLKGQVQEAIPARAPGAEGRTAAQLKDEAFAYKQKHAKTIESDTGQQAEYQRLMDAWGKADEAEQRAKK